MKNAIKTLDFNGIGIQFSADGWINATATVRDLEKGRLDNFLISTNYLEYAAEVARFNSLNSSELKLSKTGRYNSGTYLHPELVMVFARWISASFAYWCDRSQAALIQKSRNAPVLAQQARTRKLQRLGQPEAVIAMRNEGVTTRQVFTNRLKTHGVKVSGYGECTRAIYVPMFGGSTDVIRQKYGVPQKANVRDYMNLTQLSAISFAEALAAERIEKEGTYGNLACEQTCNQVGQAVARMITDTRRGLSL